MNESLSPGCPGSQLPGQPLPKRDPDELVYEIECGPEDVLYTFVYEAEPYNPGVYRDSNGTGEPPSGGYATVYEVRHPDGSVLPEDGYEAAGIDIEDIEGRIYEQWCESKMDYDEGGDDE